MSLPGKKTVSVGTATVLIVCFALSNADQVSVDAEFAGDNLVRVAPLNASSSAWVADFAIDGLDFSDSSVELLGESCDDKCMPGRTLCTKGWSEFFQGVCKVRDVRTGAWAQRVHKAFGAGKKTVKKACAKAYKRLGELIKNTLSSNEGVYWAVHKCATAGKSNRNIKCITPTFPIVEERSSNGVTILVQGQRAPGYKALAEGMMAQGLASAQQVACCALDCDGNSSNGEGPYGFFGGDIRTVKSVRSASSCRALCQDEPACKAWTWANRPRNRNHYHTCLLKNNMSKFQRRRESQYRAGCMCGYQDL